MFRKLLALSLVFLIGFVGVLSLTVPVQRVTANPVAPYTEYDVLYVINDNINWFSPDYGYCNYEDLDDIVDGLYSDYYDAYGYWEETGITDSDTDYAFAAWLDAIEIFEYQVGQAQYWYANTYALLGESDYNAAFTSALNFANAMYFPDDDDDEEDGSVFVAFVAQALLNAEVADAEYKDANDIVTAAATAYDYGGTEGDLGDLGDTLSGYNTRFSAAQTTYKALGAPTVGQTDAYNTALSAMSAANKDVSECSKYCGYADADWAKCYKDTVRATAISSRALQAAKDFQSDLWFARICRNSAFTTLPVASSALDSLEYFLK